ncbi:MAG: hypothetical protein HKN82_08870 [Akkermansiaceae bacterium]|nr:hypothetical protein [Akkermansiaceae bacterium]NNM27923.1 hypothetical protein [Akkermansiaceae bacterium]
MTRSFLAPAVAAVAISLASCGDRSARDDRPAPPDGGKQGLSGFFAPKPGEAWTYRVERRLPRHARLSAADRKRHTSLSQEGFQLEFERKRVCAGILRPEGAKREFTCIDIFEDGKLKERELYDVGPEGLFGRGWARTVNGKAEMTLSDPVPIAVPRMAAGKSWEARSTDDNRDFRFRVIERTPVTVPAGTFETARIQILSESNGRHLEHTIWFAENVGIVKEESVRSSPDAILLRETSELVDWHLPEGS